MVLDICSPGLLPALLDLQYKSLGLRLALAVQVEARLRQMEGRLLAVDSSKPRGQAPAPKYDPARQGTSAALLTEPAAYNPDADVKPSKVWHCSRFLPMLYRLSKICGMGPVFPTTPTDSACTQCSACPCTIESSHAS